jgi:septum formation protein
MHLPNLEISIQQNRSIILASSSPRRKSLLKSFGIEFTSFPPDIVEIRNSGEKPIEYVRRMALEKAEATREKFPESLILSGDTDVELDGEILGKPSDAENAMLLLERLSGRDHLVHSGYCIMDTKNNWTHVGDVTTRVCLRSLPKNWLSWYISSGEPLDKAGAYSIQGFGTLLVEHIEGSYNNVVGYPIEVIMNILLQEGLISFSTT